MRTLATLSITAAILLVSATADAQAAGRRRMARNARAGQIEKSDQMESGYVASGLIHHSAPLDPRAVYPKYQGGFHSRALQNIGVPTGDIGIRGSGFMMNPW